MLVPTSDEAVPIKGAQQRPGSDGAEIDTVGARVLRRVPRFHEPPKLLLRLRTEMDLGESDRSVIAGMRFVDRSFESRHIGRGANGLVIGENFGPVAAMR